MALYLAIPHLRMNEKPLILPDAPRREFTFFGYTFLPTDTLLFMLFLGTVIIAVFLLTALFGRVWCGWGRRRATAGGYCTRWGMCVQPCPTGIDIRDGLQMECIHCTQCMDACDAVMDKIGRPRGLIRYSSRDTVPGG